MGKHSENEYGSGGKKDLQRKALEERRTQGGFSAGNTDDKQRGRGNEDGRESGR
jgi:hypothetical protein